MAEKPDLKVDYMASKMRASHSLSALPINRARNPITAIIAG
jgi:hypothetical protein